MTILVLVSPAAIVEAITGLGNTPSHIKTGKSPCSGVKVGHGSDARAGTCAASSAIKRRGIDLNVGFMARLGSVRRQRDSVNMTVGTKPNIGSEAVGDRQIHAPADLERGCVGAAKCWKCFNCHELPTAKFEHSRLQRCLRCLARPVQEINLDQITSPRGFKPFEFPSSGSAQWFMANKPIVEPTVKQ